MTKDWKKRRKSLEFRPTIAYLSTMYIPIDNIMPIITPAAIPRKNITSESSIIHQLLYQFFIESYMLAASPKLEADTITFYYF